MGVRMERLVLGKLLKWKASAYRKPLILEGVRKDGKTWLLREFGKRFYDNTACFDFAENSRYRQFFETIKDINRILQNLMMASGQRVLPEKTLIVFDGVQDCTEVIGAMKYFCENAPQYHVVCVRSLPGIAPQKPASFPVGKVQFLRLAPMSFTEFLLADAGDKLVSHLEAVDRIEPIPEALFGPLCEKLKMYFVTGGMPQSIREWLQTRDVEAVQEALSGVIGVYERDMVRLTRSSVASKILRIWNAIPSQLAKENKKFLYRLVKEGARAREYEEALQWQVDAGLAYKICRSMAPGCRLLLLTTSRPSRSTRWMLVCFAGLPGSRPPPLSRAIGSLPNSTEP